MPGGARCRARHSGDVARKSVPHHHALDHHILAVGGQPVGRRLPAAIQQEVRQIVQRPVRLFLQASGQHRNFLCGAPQLERPNAAMRFPKCCHFVASLVNLSIARLAQPDQVVILRYHLARWPREVNGLRRHLPARALSGLNATSQRRGSPLSPSMSRVVENVPVS